MVSWSILNSDLERKVDFMKIIDTSAVFFCQEETNTNKEEKSLLNFDNDKSKKHKELADADLRAANRLLKDATEEESYYKKHAYDTKAVQLSLQAVEKYHKCIVYADEKSNKIPINLRKQLMFTHDIEFLQKETENADINILDKKDISALTQAIDCDSIKNPYNAMRYDRQNLKHTDAETAVLIAKKAKKNLKRMIKQQLN